MRNKKITSILLILVMMLSLVPSIALTGYAQTSDPVSEFYDVVKEKFSPILNSGDMAKALTIFSAVTKNGFSSEINTGLGKISSSGKNILIQNGFVNANGSDKAIENILNKATNEEKIAAILVKIMNNEDQNINSDIVALYTDIYDALPSEVKEKEFIKYGSTKEEKIGVLLELVKGMYDAGDKIVTEADGKIKILLPSGYIKDANAILAEKVMQGEAPIVLSSVHEEAINVFLEVLSQKINADATAKQAVKDLAIKLNLYEAPSTSGGSGGGGGGGSSSPSDDTSSTVETSVPKESIEIKTEGNITVVTVKTEDLTKSIESMIEKMKENGTATVNIDLKEVKDLNAKVSLPVQALKKLEGKNANIIIKTNKLEIVIPLQSIRLKNEKSNIVLDTKEINKEDLKHVVKNEIKSLVKAVELNLLEVEGSTSTKIDAKFAKKVKIGIDISDLNVDTKKAVVLFIDDNGNTAVVGGKIKNSKIYANLAHFSQYAVAEREVTFEDVKDHWSKEFVESMAAKNVINGYEDKTFKPENKVTRGEFAKLLVETLELDKVDSTVKFADAKDHWAKAYIQTAYEAGLITGYDENTFAPNEKITRAQMATMLGRAIESDKKADLSEFNDSTFIPAWAKEAAAKAVGEELIKGDNSSFRPNDNTTRGEATTVIYRLFNR